MSEEFNAEVARQVSQQMQMLSPTMTQIAVTQAVVAALVSTHPDPTLLRQRAESLLMQAQAGLASSGMSAPSGGQFPRLLPDAMTIALDYIFRPPVQIDPD